MSSEPNPKQITDAFLVIWIGLLVGYDLASWLGWGPDATVSARLLDFVSSSRWLWGAVLVGLGIVLGHIFVPQYR